MCVAHNAIGAGSVVASRFRLEDLLAEDAGARFWRATDLTLVRNVALHVIRADDLRAPAVLTAARTSATVSDGHILRVLDALHEGDFVYVVHEWGSGVSLDRMLGEGTVEPRRAVWLVREVAEAIAVAHRQGVAHGRLLPDNVLLTDVGSVKLIGFVVAAVLQGRPQREGATGDPPSEHESDVLNLGALLYACLTGRWPGFPQSTLPDAPDDHGRVCRPRQVRPGVPRRLDALCDQILNPDPRTGVHRFESAAEIHAALGDYLGDSLSGATVAVSGPTALLERPGYSDADADSDSAAGTDSGTDPDATQAGLPRFEATQAGLPRFATDPAPPHSDPRAAPPDTPTDTPLDTPTGASHRTEAVPRPEPAPMGPAWTARSGTGQGDGPVPPAWGPDPARRHGSAPMTPEKRPGSRSLRFAALVAVLGLVLLAVVVGVWLQRDQQPEQSAGPDASPTATATASAPPEVVQPAAVRDFDPEQQDGGSPEENPDLVPLATDGNPATAWETLTYEDGPVLAPYKAGVGLLLDLGAETPVRDVRVTLVGSPYDLQLLAAPPESGAPTSVEGLTEVDTRSGVLGNVRLKADEAVTTRYLVLWLTALPPGDDGGYVGRIGEVVVRS